jgi:hypothetical protein
MQSLLHLITKSPKGQNSGFKTALFGNKQAGEYSKKEIHYALYGNKGSQQKGATVEASRAFCPFGHRCSNE